MGTRAPGPGWCLLVLVLLPDAGGVVQEYPVLQSQGPVSVSAGETLELNCTMPPRTAPGPVRWFLGSGSGRRLVYAETGSFPRVTKAVPSSTSDYTIYISDVRPEDAGTYYCVKFKKGLTDEEIQSGAGTVVSVSGQCLLSSPGLWVGYVLGKGLIGTFLFFLFVRRKEP